MALSNPPAVTAAAALEALTSPDDAVIRLRIGGVTYGIPLRDIGVQLSAHMPDFVTGAGDLTAKDQLFRTSLKAVLPTALRMLEPEVQKANAALVAQGKPPLPLPDLKQRHHDLLDYTTRYLAAVVLMAAASQEWEATCGETVEGPDGYVRLSGLSSGVAAPQGAGPDAPSE